MTRIDRLHSPELPVVLKELPSSVCGELAKILCEFRMPNPVTESESHCARSLRLNRSGYYLVQDIVDDFHHLGRHTTGPAYSYRQILQGVARRHSVIDNSERMPASIEREILRRYMPWQEPKLNTFKDQGSDSFFQRAAYAVAGPGWLAYAMSPSWNVVTAVTLKIAVERRIALTIAHSLVLEL